MPTSSQTFTTSGTFVPPANAVQGSFQIEAWGAGGAGAAIQGSGFPGGGGGGGEYTKKTGISLPPLTLNCAVVIGAGGTSGTPNGGDTTIHNNSGTLVQTAKGGAGAPATGASGAGGNGGDGVPAFKGGDGGASMFKGLGGGGGGGSGGTAAAGNNGGGGGSTAGGAGGAAVVGGGAGGNGGSGTNGVAATAVGGGGGGGGTVVAGGFRGQMIITWTVLSTGTPSLISRRRVF